MIQLATRMTLFRSLAYQPFALLWAGQSISRLGDFLYQIVLAWWVLKATGSAAAMATVFSLTLAPTLLFLLVGGVAVDRYPRARLMLAADLGRGILVAVMAGLALAGQLQIETIYLISLMFGLLDAFFNPAYAALVPTLVPTADLTSANSLTSLSVQAARIIGPALGAALLTAGGMEWAIAFNALTFFISAAFLVPLALKESQPQRVEHEGHGWSQVVADLRQGLAEVAGQSWLWLNILVFAVINLTLGGPYVIALPFLVNDTLHQGADTLGLLYAMFAVGYGIAGIWLGNRTRISHRGWRIFLGTAVAGLMLALFGLPLPLGVLMAAAVINGYALQMAALSWISSVQELVPVERLGRVSSLDEIGSLALIPLGFAAAGWATEQVGPEATFLMGGLATAVLTLGLLLAVPSLRRMN